MINNSINKAIKFLSHEQNIDGSFTTLSIDSTGSSQKHVSPFYAALIVSSLRSLSKIDGVDAVLKKSTSFLLTQKSIDWSFNYWVRESKESKATPYPDDLDVTFCALSALFLTNPKLISGKVMAKAVDLLTQLELKEGGPYKTWLVPTTAGEIWKDTDIAVNSNIGFFLKLIGANLPNLNKLVDKNLTSNNMKSPYYVGELPVIYFISRFYAGKNVAKLIKRIESAYSEKKGWGSPLNTALAISALLNFKSTSKVEEGIEYLLTQQTKGHWGAEPFVIELNRGQTVTAGSNTLTTAFCIEALNSYRRTQQIYKIEENEDTGATAVRGKVLSLARDQIVTMPSLLGTKTLHKIEQMSQLDSQHSITTLPYIFFKSIGSSGTVISDKLILRLGTANLFGWIAYTIYDDILDEGKDLDQLPVANASLRFMTNIYIDLARYIPEFEKAFHDVINKIDNANAWEAKNRGFTNGTRPSFGKLEKLSDKSFGIVLGPLYIMFRLGYYITSPQTKLVLSFFTHYLIARQLNDDAHDWEEDLKNGHFTPVTVLILRTKMEKKDNHKNLKDIFWDETIFKVCDLIDKHLKEAREALYSSKVIVNPSYLDNLLIPIEAATVKARIETKKTKDFISAYK